METLQSLRRQLDAAEDLRSVAKTMKGMAAVSIRRFQVATEALAAYVETVDLGFRVLLRDHPQLLAGLDVAPAGRVGVVVLGTDQGLCGSVNRDVATRAAAWLAGDAPPGGPLVLALGRRVAAELEALGLEVSARGPMPSTVEGVTEAVRAALLRIRDWQDDADVSRVVLVHHRPTTRSGSRPRVSRLIPVDADRIRQASREPWPTRTLPSFSASPATILASLVEESVSAGLFRAFTEALASEHARRLATMQSAERSIDERLEQLTGRLHQLRQASITQELLEVVAGFEVLEGADPRARGGGTEGAP